MKAFSMIVDICVDLRFQLYVRAVEVAVGGLFTSRDKQINPLGSKLWSASRPRFYLTRAQYCATFWSMDEKKKSVTGDWTCVVCYLLQNQYSVLFPQLNLYIVYLIVNFSFPIQSKYVVGKMLHPNL